MAKVKSQAQMKKDDTAPGFDLPATDGRSHNLEDLGGKEGLLVLFMCNHCPYVKARINEVVELHKEFGALAFVGINSSDPDYPGEGMENMKVFVKERGITFLYLLDEDGKVAQAYGATCTPDPFLFDKNLKLVFHGRITDALEPQDATNEYTMRDNIHKLFKGGKIEPWFNPSLGCSLKFKS